MMGLLSLLLSPFIFVFLLIYFIFKYGEVTSFVHSTPPIYLPFPYGIIYSILFSLSSVVYLIYSSYSILFYSHQEIRARPGSFTARQWSPLARWKFRELNELPHIFTRRLNASVQLAERYVNSFPFDVLTIVARYIYNIYIYVYPNMKTSHFFIRLHMLLYLHLFIEYISIYDNNIDLFPSSWDLL